MGNSLFYTLIQYVCMYGLKMLAFCESFALITGNDAVDLCTILYYHSTSVRCHDCSASVILFAGSCIVSTGGLTPADSGLKFSHIGCF